jgi:hypothetical protein
VNRCTGEKEPEGEGKYLSLPVKYQIGLYVMQSREKEGEELKLLNTHVHFHPLSTWRPKGDKPERWDKECTKGSQEGIF